MKKWLGISVLILFVLIAAAGIFLFSPPGNALVASKIEAQLREQFKLPSSVDAFVLTTSAFKIEFTLSDGNRIEAGGDYSIFSQSLNANYRVGLEDLAALEPLTKQPLEGAFRTNGSISGSAEKMVVEGVSDVALSDTNYRIVLKDFQPDTVDASVNALKIAEVLKILKMPHYADGSLNATVKLRNAKMGELDGTVMVELPDGLADSKVLSKAFEWGPMPKTTFTLRSDTVLKGSLADTKTLFSSTLAKFSAPDMHTDLENGSVKGSYRVDIADLDKLYFISNQHLLGGIRIDGTYKKDDHLALTANGDLCGGRFHANILDNELNATLKTMQTMKLLKMLTYPEMFASQFDAVVNYDTLAAKGTMNAKLTNGKFQRSDVLDLVQTFLVKGDIYKDALNGTFDTVIVQEKINADLLLTSKKTSITSKNIKLDTKAKLIDAKIDIVANKNPLSFTLKGKIDDPKVTIDADKIIEKETEKLIEKGVDQLLKNMFK